MKKEVEEALNEIENLFYTASDGVDFSQVSEPLQKLRKALTTDRTLEIVKEKLKRENRFTKGEKSYISTVLEEIITESEAEE